jgi:hypothetical protein
MSGMQVHGRSHPSGAGADGVLLNGLDTGGSMYFAGPINGQIWPGDRNDTFEQFENAQTWQPDGSRPDDAWTALPLQSRIWGSAAEYLRYSSTKLLRVNDDGTITALNWQGLDGAAGYAYGQSVLQRANWDPGLRYDFPAYTVVEGIRYPVGSLTRPLSVVDAPTFDAWTAEQWPYGGLLVRTLDGTNTYQEAFRTSCRPCWIIQNVCRPFPTHFEITVANDGVETFGQRWGGPGIRDSATFAFQPANGAGVNHCVFEHYNDLEPLRIDGLTMQFMGVPQYVDGSQAPSRTINNPRDPDDQYFGYHYTFMPSGGGSHPTGDRQPAVANREQNYLDYKLSKISERAPHMKVDSAFSMRRLEFTRPAALDDLPEGTVVESATAEVRFTNGKRVEFWGEFFVPPVGISFAGRTPPDGEKDGWHVRQLSRNASTGEEEWLTVHKVVFVADGANGGSYESDDTHRTRDYFEDEVEAATGERPDIDDGDRQAPRFIPRETPWYPSNSIYRPATINPLEGLRVNFAVIGMQEWATMMGREAGDLTVDRSKKELERLLLFHPDGVSIEGWEPRDGDPTDPADDDRAYLQLPGDHYEQAGNDDYIDGLAAREEVPSTVAGLENWRYRWVARCAPNRDGEEDDEHVPSDEWFEMDLTPLAEAILADKPRTAGNAYGDDFTLEHQRYRLVPCGTGPLSRGLSAYEGEHQNIANLFESLWPEEINVPKTYESNGNTFAGMTSTGFAEEYKPVVHQWWEDVRVRNFVIVFRRPDDSTYVWNIGGN